MAWSKFKTGSMKPVRLSASGLFRGTATGTAVAAENLFSTGLNLILLLMRYRFMVNGLVVIYYRIRAASIELIIHCFHTVITNMAVGEEKVATATNLLIPCGLVYHGSCASLVYGVRAVLCLPRVLMGRLVGGTGRGLGVGF